MNVRVNDVIQKMNLVFLLASLVGHTGKIISTSFVPTESWVRCDSFLQRYYSGINYLSPFMGDLFVRMVSNNLPPPQLIWVDDWAKWHSKIEGLVQQHWPNGTCIVGQDWFHFRLLFLTHANKAHPQYRRLCQSFTELLHRVRTPDLPESITSGLQLLTAVTALYNDFGPKSLRDGDVTRVLPPQKFVKTGGVALFQALGSVVKDIHNCFLDVDIKELSDNQSFMKKKFHVCLFWTNRWDVYCTLNNSQIFK